MEQLSALSVHVTEAEFLDQAEELGLEYAHIIYITREDGSILMRRKIEGDRWLSKVVPRIPRPGAAPVVGGKVVPIVKNPRKDLLKEDLNILPGGKIPSLLLYQIIAFFKSVMDNKMQDVLAPPPNTNFKSFQHEYEAMAHIVWNSNTKEYRVCIPTQRVSKASLSYDRDHYRREDGDIMVVDIHSHNTMGGHYSVDVL